MALRNSLIRSLGLRLIAYFLIPVIHSIPWIRRALKLPDNGFVDLDNAAKTAHRRKRAVTHRFANTMAQKPRGLVGKRKNATAIAAAS